MDIHVHAQLLASFHATRHRVNSCCILCMVVVHIPTKPLNSCVPEASLAGFD